MKNLLALVISFFSLFSALLSIAACKNRDGSTLKKDPMSPLVSVRGKVFIAKPIRCDVARNSTYENQFVDEGPKMCSLEISFDMTHNVKAIVTELMSKKSIVRVGVVEEERRDNRAHIEGNIGDNFFAATFYGPGWATPHERLKLKPDLGNEALSANGGELGIPVSTTVSSIEVGNATVRNKSFHTESVRCDVARAATYLQTFASEGPKLCSLKISFDVKNGIEVIIAELATGLSINKPGVLTDEDRRENRSGVEGQIDGNLFFATFYDMGWGTPHERNTLRPDVSNAVLSAHGGELRIPRM